MSSLSKYTWYEMNLNFFKILLTLTISIPKTVGLHFAPFLLKSMVNFSVKDELDW